MTILAIPKGEQGRIRVFALSMTAKEAKALAANGSTVPETDGGRSYQEDVLGTEGIDHEFVQVFAVKDLEGVGLADFLVEGHGAEPQDIKTDKTKLGALGGWVMVVLSKAFRGIARDLDLDPRLTLIGVYPQEGVDWSPAPVTSASAEPYSADTKRKKPMSDARISGMVAMAVLLFLAAFVTVFILLAG